MKKSTEVYWTIVSTYPKTQTGEWLLRITNHVFAEKQDAETVRCKMDMSSAFETVKCRIRQDAVVVEIIK